MCFIFQSISPSYRAEDKKRRLFLTSLLTPEARERLDRIKMVNYDKYVQVSELICLEADEGYINQRVTEDQLKTYVEQVNNRSKFGSTGNVTIVRKKASDDSDDENYDDL